MNEANRELYLKSLQKWGKVLQVNMAVEEMAELTFALMKELRTSNEERRSNWGAIKRAILDEIVDVSILLEQLRVIYFISDAEYEQWRKQKLARLRERLIDAEESNEDDEEFEEEEF